MTATAEHPVTQELVPSGTPAKPAAKAGGKKVPTTKPGATKKLVNKKAPAKAAPAKPAAKAEGHKKEGLRKPQIRVLKALLSGKEMTRKEIAEKGEVDQAFLTSYIGSNDPDIRAKTDKQVCMSLLTLGYVKAVVVQGEGYGPTTYQITAKGKAAYEKAVKEEKEAK